VESIAAHPAGSLVSGVAAGLADEQRRQAETQASVRHAEQERCRAKTKPISDEPGGERGQREGAVARGLIESHG
jgi:hypothetical protein